MAIVTEIEGNIFDAPPNSVLVQACNARGVWGKGVAQAFKTKFPNAFQEYKQICTVKPSSSLSLSVHQQSLPGQCLLISIGHDIDSNIPEGSYYHIASLITSEGYGKTVSPKDDITTSTELAITDLQAKLSALKKTALPVGDIYAVKINSGLFKVPWLETKRTLEAGPLDLIIVSPPA